jgi:hypothetical protein
MKTIINFVLSVRYAKIMLQKKISVQPKKGSFLSTLMGHSTLVLVVNLKLREHLGDIGVDGRIILRKQVARMWNRIIWFRTEYSGKLL